MYGRQNEKPSGNETKQNSARKKLGLTEGLLIASIPVCAYGVALTFEMSYCWYFGIPFQLIEISMVDIAKALGLLTFIGFFVFVFIDLISFFKDIIPFTLIRNFIKVVPLLIMTGIAIFCFREAWEEWAPFASIFILFAAFNFLLPVVSHRKIKGYINKLNAADELDDSVKNLSDWLSTQVRPHVNIVIASLFIAFTVSYIAGRAFAMRNTYFIVINNPEEKVLLRIYEDKFICAEFNRTDGTIKNDFTVIKLSDSREIAYHWETVGKLKLIKHYQHPRSKKYKNKN